MAAAASRSGAVDSGSDRCMFSCETCSEAARRLVLRRSFRLAASHRVTPEDQKADQNGQGQTGVVQRFPDFYEQRFHMVSVAPLAVFIPTISVFMCFVNFTGRQLVNL